MKQYLTRKLHLAGGEGLGSHYGLDTNWNSGHPLRKAWCCKTNKLNSNKQLAPKKINREKTRRS